MSTPTGLEMLPLIVGALDDKEDRTGDGADTDDDVVDAEVVSPDGTKDDTGKNAKT
jgi:HemY protein